MSNLRGRRIKSQTALLAMEEAALQVSPREKAVWRIIPAVKIQATASGAADSSIIKPPERTGLFKLPCLPRLPHLPRLPLQ